MVGQFQNDGKWLNSCFGLKSTVSKSKQTIAFSFNLIIIRHSTDLELQNLSEDEDESCGTTSRTPTPLRKLIFIIEMIHKS